MHIFDLAGLACVLSLLFVSPDAKKKITILGRAQGTTYQITYYAADSIVTKSSIDSVLDRLDSSLSLYKSYSIISRFNRSASGVEMDEHFEKVVRKSMQTNLETSGLFDITVGSLVEAWGFGPDKAAMNTDGRHISRLLLRCVGPNRIKISGRYLRKSSPCVKIDMNGIAQGYSVDVLGQMLERRGIADYLVELGGEIRIRGRKHPGLEKMKVGIEKPSSSMLPAGLQEIITIDSGAITTSGNYRRYYESNGKIITHIIHPRTGYSLPNEMISVAVYAQDAMTADAYDNAIMLMGMEMGIAFVDQHPELAAYIIYKDPQGRVHDTASKRFRSLFQ